MAATFHIDTAAFHRALEEYMKVSRSTVRDVVTRRCFFVALRALQKSPQTRADVMKEKLFELTQGHRMNKESGHYETAKGQAPRINLIIQKKAADAGKPGFYGKAMRDEERKLLSKRRYMSAFLKAGWLPALVGFGKEYQAASGYSLRGKEPKQLRSQARNIERLEGRIGRYQLHTAPDNTTGMLENMALQLYPRFSQPQLAQEALQEAITFEAEQMKRETERRLEKAAQSSHKAAERAIELMED